MSGAVWPKWLVSIDHDHVKRCDCGSLIRFGTTKKGKSIPLEADVAVEIVPHHARCPLATLFRASRKEKR